jgi:hypothetical protein
MSYKEAIFQILDLQKAYSMQKTAEMETRRSLLKQIEKDLKFDLEHYSTLNNLRVKSKSSTGYNSLIPWVRIYDPNFSPKPSVGWYVVMLFPTQGDHVYISLNQGTNSISKHGDLKRESLEIIKTRTVNARGQLNAQNARPNASVEVIDLKARQSSRGLAEGYEHGNVFAFVLTKATSDFDSYLLECINELEQCRRLIGDSPVEMISEASYKRPVYLGKKDKGSPEVFTKDPAKLERALMTHIDTQNQISDIISGKGFKPLSPGKGKKPDYDIAWKSYKNFWIVEVKSLPNGGETSQLRIGLGQLLHYKEQLRKKYPKLTIRTVLALEKRPEFEEMWRSICDDSNIVFCYGPEFRALIKLFDTINQIETSEV